MQLILLHALLHATVTIAINAEKTACLDTLLIGSKTIFVFVLSDIFHIFACYLFFISVKWLVLLLSTVVYFEINYMPKNLRAYSISLEK
jgi:hypothetical protein